jgi:hypothetical protein
MNGDERQAASVQIPVVPHREWATDVSVTSHGETRRRAIAIGISGDEVAWAEMTQETCLVEDSGVMVAEAAEPLITLWHGEFGGQYDLEDARRLHAWLGLCGASPSLPLCFADMRPERDLVRPEFCNGLHEAMSELLDSYDRSDLR